MSAKYTVLTYLAQKTPDLLEEAAQALARHYYHGNLEDAGKR